LVTDNLQVGDILQEAPFTETTDPEAVAHGLIFGDGTGHKSRSAAERIESQGRQYCSIRLCGKDKDYLEYFQGYTVTYPPSANGDPVVYVGRKKWKDLPFTTDPGYIAGFIKGWWLADGAKTEYSADVIYTTQEQAVEWLTDHAAYAGYVVSGVRKVERKAGDGSYPNGKPLYVVRLSRHTGRKVTAVEPYGREEVFCLEEPVTTGFVLANGLLTGNCSTACMTPLKFYLLLNGSGVGRDYSDALMRVDWTKAPKIRNILRRDHPDFEEWMDDGADIIERDYSRVRTWDEESKSWSFDEVLPDNPRARYRRKVGDVARFLCHEPRRVVRGVIEPGPAAA
jgi:hypothetical protein